MRIYVTADTHYNHPEIISYCNRPLNSEELIFNNMKFLRESDCLVHLGDFCLGKEAEVHKKYLEPIKATKILVRGNHDSKSFSWYMEHGWDFVCDAFRLNYCGKIVLFSHIPQAWDGIWEVNIHGHLHNLGHRDKEYHFNKTWHKLYAQELMKYTPIELSKVIQTLTPAP